MKIDLKAERLNRGLSLRQAADELGVSDATILRAEDTGLMPHPRNALKIASFYGYKVTDIWPVEQEQAA